MSIKRTVAVGRVILGEGVPAVCVPVMGKSLEEIAQAARKAAAAQADLIELRIDSLSAMPEEMLAVDACRVVRKAAPGIPILFTLRTARDGGPGSADGPAYEALLAAVARTHACDAVDCELSVGEEAFLRIVQAAHEAGIPVVGSSHEFGEIGDVKRIGCWLRRQAALGADVCKAAVMALNRVQAMEMAAEMTRAADELEQPCIAIAMGAAGVISRAACECMGSCLTFGTAGQASAPGQMDAQALRHVLTTIHAAISAGE